MLCLTGHTSCATARFSKWFLIKLNRLPLQSLKFFYNTQSDAPILSTLPYINIQNDEIHHSKIYIVLITTGIMRLAFAFSGHFLILKLFDVLGEPLE